MNPIRTPTPVSSAVRRALRRPGAARLARAGLAAALVAATITTCAPTPARAGGVEVFAAAALIAFVAAYTNQPYRAYQQPYQPPQRPRATQPIPPATPLSLNPQTPSAAGYAAPSAAPSGYAPTYAAPAPAYRPSYIPSAPNSANQTGFIPPTAPSSPAPFGAGAPFGTDPNYNFHPHSGSSSP